MTDLSYWISPAAFYRAIASADVAMARRDGEYYVTRANGEAITYGADRETAIGHLRRCGADRETIIRLLRDLDDAISNA